LFARLSSESNGANRLQGKPAAALRPRCVNYGQDFSFFEQLIYPRPRSAAAFDQSDNPPDREQQSSLAVNQLEVAHPRSIRRVYLRGAQGRPPPHGPRGELPAAAENRSR
jgi:hypothetical protein